MPRAPVPGSSRTPPQGRGRAILPVRAGSHRGRCKRNTGPRGLFTVVIMASAGWIVRGVTCAVLAVLVALSFPTLAPASNTMAVQPDGKIVLAGLSPQQSDSGVRDMPSIVR